MPRKYTPSKKRLPLLAYDEVNGLTRKSVVWLPKIVADSSTINITFCKDGKEESKGYWVNASSAALNRHVLKMFEDRILEVNSALVSLANDINTELKFCRTNVDLIALRSAQEKLRKSNIERSHS